MNGRKITLPYNQEEFEEYEVVTEVSTRRKFNKNIIFITQKSIKTSYKIVFCRYVKKHMAYSQ